MLKLYLWIHNLLVEEEGQTLTEYALILLLISIVAIAVMAAVGTEISDLFTTATDAVAVAGAG